MNIDKSAIIESYLIDLGVNVNIISYLKETKILLNKYFENILGKDFYMWNDKQHKNEFLQKLREGSEEFKIFDNGGIWFSSKYNPKLNTSPSFVQNSGFLSISEDEKYEEIKTNYYISFENGSIRKKVLLQKKKDKDSQIYYDGSFSEEILNTKTKEKTRTNSSFSNSTTIPPTNYLETRIENVNEFGFAKKRNFKNINYHTSLWYLVANGNIKNQKLIENLNTKKLSTKEKFKLIKQNIFRKGKASNQIELYQQLSKQEIDVLDNENPEEIIHSEFSIKGKNGKDCIWTVEKVTTSSREVIFQIEFQNTEQFRKQILMPLLITFAQSNSIMKGLINSINEKQFQYRAYSTSSNVLTVNNISKEYAEFILNEIKKVEPTIYNKKIEQIEKQNQKIENEIDYQKVNKKSEGFLDVLLLTSIVVFFSILMLIIMFMIWKNNI